VTRKLARGTFRLIADPGKSCEADDMENLMPFSIDCPWCEAEVPADVTDPAVTAIRCPACSTTVELEPIESIALPIAA
jgi:hypothetical protein